MNPRHLLPLIGFVALAALLGAGLGLRPREVPSPFIDKPAPDFKLPTLHDPSRHVAPAELRGQVWVLNVWASWCAPCRDEHPVIVQAAGQASVAFLGLNYKDDPRNAQEWLLRLGNPYRMNLSDRDGRVGIDYGVYGSIAFARLMGREIAVELAKAGAFLEDLSPDEDTVEGAEEI